MAENDAQKEALKKLAAKLKSVAAETKKISQAAEATDASAGAVEKENK